MREEINLRSLRARKARLSKSIGPTGYLLLSSVAGALALLGLYLLVFSHMGRLAYVTLALASLAAMLSLWYQYDLRILPLVTPAKRIDDIMEQGLLASLKYPITPSSTWQAACHNPEAIFICNHLLIDWRSLGSSFSNNEKDMDVVWQQANRLIDTTKNPKLHSGVLATAMILTCPNAQPFLTANKLRPEEVNSMLNWVERHISYFSKAKPYFGGIGRDWATGFTPTLDHFGQNISRYIEKSGGLSHYIAHNDLLDSITNSLEHSNAVALVGQDGTGKTTLVHGLAQHLLEGREPSLKYYQIISLNASLILSNDGVRLENLILHLFGEAVMAGNIILYLDDAQLFFSSGTGSIDISQILLPILKNRNLKIITAFNPSDWQRLQGQNPALANSLASITVTEPSESATYAIVEDATLMLEYRYKTLVSYESIREAYRLSGQFMQDQSYPGKAINLLERSMPYAQHNALTAESVQEAIEKTQGVKVSAAKAPEADMLLHLEEHIHDRMINQKHAVAVVSAALRRGRAGVANPKRPVGSFLFLGPTGVGKTELARSLAATYFGDEHQMIRLDMSEYQQPDSVARLLAASSQSVNSLLLAIREQPFSVVLLDEIEKAHPNVLNLLLQMLDEGQLTDQQGRPASFRSAIVIATSNAGASDIAEQVKNGGTLKDFERPLIEKLITSGQFKPELINRFDEIVLFRQLNEEELGQVAQIMLREVNRTLDNQQITVRLTPEALKQIVHIGYDPKFGARPMRRVIQKTVEDIVAVKILRKEAQPGDTVIIDMSDLNLNNQEEI